MKGIAPAPHHYMDSPLTETLEYYGYSTIKCSESMYLESMTAGLEGISMIACKI